ncbi:hypothetical protein H5410_020304 [Solanum commersonii]|uniref:Uncharacterized protein n=1 Tax=Solanum commersonii TaxID=4109 RepID=A0A9J5ZAS6_SOLCO|nr:hypothetical protein H5410_020304 [Solanum commersonii]
MIRVLNFKLQNSMHQIVKMENDLCMFFSVLLLIGNWRCWDGSALWNESFLLKLCYSALRIRMSVYWISFFLVAATSRLIYSRNSLKYIGVNGSLYMIITYWHAI